MPLEVIRNPYFTRRDEPLQPYSYIVYTDGKYVYAKNGQTGQIEFSGTDASTVIQNAINQLGTNGGKIFVKSGRYTLSSTITLQPDVDLEFERNRVRIDCNANPTFNVTASNPIHYIKISGGYFGSSKSGINIFHITGQGNFILEDMVFYGDYAIQRNILPIRIVVYNNYFHVKISRIHAYSKYFIRIEKDPTYSVLRQSVMIDKVTWFNDFPDGIMIDVYTNSYGLYNISAENIHGYYTGTGINMTTENTGFIYFCRFNNIFLQTNKGIYINASGGEIADVFFSNVFLNPQGANSYGFYATGKIHTIMANQLSVQFPSDSGVTGIAILPSEKTSTRGGHFVFTNLRLYDVLSSQYSIVTNNNFHDSMFTGAFMYLSNAQINGTNVRIISPSSIQSGKATFSGDGTTKQFRIAHTLSLTPSKVLVTPGSNDAIGTFYVTADNAYIYVNYETAPPPGTGNIVLYWYAEV